MTVYLSHLFWRGNNAATALPHPCMLNSQGNAEVWVRVGVEKGHYGKTNMQEKSASKRGSLYFTLKENKTYPALAFIGLSCNALHSASPMDATGAFVKVD